MRYNDSLLLCYPTFLMFHVIAKELIVSQSVRLVINLLLISDLSLPIFTISSETHCNATGIETMLIQTKFLNALECKHGGMLPLENKWVSKQIEFPVTCTFLLLQS